MYQNNINNKIYFLKENNQFFIEQQCSILPPPLYYFIYGNTGSSNLRSSATVVPVGSWPVIIHILFS